MREGAKEIDLSEQAEKTAKNKKQSFEERKGGYSISGSTAKRAEVKDILTPVMDEDEEDYRGLLGRKISGEKLDPNEEEKLLELSGKFREKVGVEKEGDIEVGENRRKLYEFESKEEAEIALLELENKATDMARDAIDKNDDSLMMAKEEFQTEFRAIVEAGERAEDKNEAA